MILKKKRSMHLVKYNTKNENGLIRHYRHLFDNAIGDVHGTIEKIVVSYLKAYCIFLNSKRFDTFCLRAKLSLTLI